MARVSRPHGPLHQVGLLRRESPWWAGRADQPPSLLLSSMGGRFCPGFWVPTLLWGNLAGSPPSTLR